MNFGRRNAKSGTAREKGLSGAASRMKIKTPPPPNETPWDLLLRIMEWQLKDHKTARAIFKTSHEKINGQLDKCRR